MGQGICNGQGLQPVQVYEVKYRAVVFDLFGTLVDQPTREEVRTLHARMAEALGLPVADFQREWRATTPQRTTGRFPTLEANLEHVCRALGRTPDSAAIAEAMARRDEFQRRVLVPRSDALTVLQELEGAGCGVGLISNCSPEVPALWHETLMAPLVHTSVFSSEVGLAKPDPRIYHLACQGLQAVPGQCVYVGNGDDHELTGAAAAGLHPVRIRSSYRHPAGHEALTAGDPWEGASIRYLAELLSLLH